MVLDEIEKAHPDLFNILLQVMDHATLTDNNGRKADFRNVVLILTTNAGAREMSSKTIGFGGGDALIDTAKAKEAIERTFTPEFRNRLDGWILFAGLGPEIILKVVDKEVGLLQAQLSDKKVTLELTPAARGWLAEHGYDPMFGARPMARLVDQSLKKPLAEALLFGALQAGGVAKVRRAARRPRARAADRLGRAGDRLGRDGPAVTRRTGRREALKHLGDVEGGVRHRGPRAQSARRPSGERRDLLGDGLVVALGRAVERLVRLGHRGLGGQRPRVEHRWGAAPPMLFRVFCSAKRIGVRIP